MENRDPVAPVFSTGPSIIEILQVVKCEITCGMVVLVIKQRSAEPVEGSEPVV
jgi:hypothetical protein